MDVGFSILIPVEAELVGFSFKRDVYYWGDEPYPQGYPYCDFGKHFRLIDMPIPGYIPMYIPGYFYKKKWRCLVVEGDGLDEYRGELLGHTVKWGGCTLPVLLESVLGQVGDWIVAYELGYDRVDKIVSCRPDEVCNLIASSMIQKEEGFCAIPVF